MRTIQPKILEIPGAKLNGKKTSGRKKVSKIWVYLARLSSFLEILENVVPFATGSSRIFKSDVLIEWKTPVVSANWIWRISRGLEPIRNVEIFEWIINDLTLRHFPWAYTCDFCVAFGLLHRVSGLFAASELPLGDCPLCKQDTWPSYLHVRECRKYLKLWSYRVKAKKRFFLG